MLQRIENEQRDDVNSDELLSNREATINNAGLDKETSQGEPIGGRNNTSGRANQGESEIATFTTPQREVYGFVDEKGEMYLDLSKAS